MTTWFTADTHFLHNTVAGLRGFDSREAHDEELIARWNSVVSPTDTVWHLGDVGLGNEARVLELAGRLNGYKHLVAGNHDVCWPGHTTGRKHQRRWLRVFMSVQAFAKVRLDGRTVLLSHFPYAGGGDHTDEERYPQFRLPDQGLWLLHGHVHSTERVHGGRMLHVGMDAWGDRPVSDDRVAEVIAAAEAGNTSPGGHDAEGA
jgi:calcineurin-like phosphoesterase family protein